MRYVRSSALILSLSGMLAGCLADGPDTASGQQAVGSTYIVSCSGALPADFAARAAARGDAVGHLFAAAGFATVSTSSPGFYNKGTCFAVRDVSTTWTEPTQEVLAAEVGNPPASNDDDFLFDLQWGHDAVNAPEAWNAGHRGAGVRVAVLDTGFDLTHPDLVPNIDFALSRDMTGQGLAYSLPDPYSHGTHTAGTVAAADNGFGTIGIAPEADLVLVKVLYDEGYGSFGDVLAGMYYATSVDADVISMSIGALFPRRDDTGPGKLVVAMNRAAIWARQNGTAVIAAAGNESVDFDHTGDWINMPGGATGVLQIAATAPIGWATAAGSDLDLPTPYSNYGRSAIAFAAPGGNWSYPGNELCTVGAIQLTRPCWVFDLVLSTGNKAWFWAAGTSMATPHAAGVAALILGEGEVSSPAELEQALRQRSSDLGVPGQDPIYGFGRVASGY